MKVFLMLGILCLLSGCLTIEKPISQHLWYVAAVKARSDQDHKQIIKTLKKCGATKEEAIYLSKVYAGSSLREWNKK